MASLGEWIGRLKSLLRRREYERRLREETELHLAMLVDENRARGMSEDEALRAAQFEFGSRNQLQEEFHAQSGLPFLESIVADVRFGLRSLLKSPSFTIVSLLTLALGIGANTAIYSYVDATWLRPMQVPDAGRMVVVYSSGREGSNEVLDEESSYLDYLDLRAQTKTLEDVVAYEHRGAIIYRGNEARELLVDVVSPNYFTALGIAPKWGRTFTEKEAADYAPVVLSFGFWKQYFGADRGVVGSQVRLSNGIVTIAGVLPPSFRGADIDLAPAIFMPTTTWTHITGSRTEFTVRDNRRQTILGRTKEGVSLAAVKAEMDSLAARLRAAYPADDKDLKFTIRRESDRRGEDSRRAGLMLLGIAGMVILIACANVANLQMARSEGRRKEIATRLALGCRRARIIRQLLTESALMTAMGGVLALGVAYVAIAILPKLFNNEMAAVDHDFRLDYRVLLFTFGISTVAALLFGSIAAFHASRVELVGAMKDSEMRGSRRGRLSLRNLLVSGQIALALILLVAAGLLARTLQKVRTIDAGFNSKQHLLMLYVVPGLAIKEDAQLANYYNIALERLGALPGVVRASMTLRMPFSPAGGGMRETIAVAGVQPPPGQEGFDINDHVVGPNFFEVMGTRVLRGRAFQLADNAKAPKVVVINQKMARQFWQDQDPVGRQLEVVGRTRVPYSVVGVVQDTKWNALTESDRPLIYFPFAQSVRGEMTILLATRQDPATLVNAARTELARINPAVPLLSATPLSEYMETTVAAERNRVLLSSAFSALGLVLAIIGVYGVMAYYLSQRTREIGIRMAIGAEPSQVLGMVLRRGLKMTLVGIAVGLVGALLTRNLFAGLLYGVQPSDPWVLLVAALLLGTVATVASYLPARYATRIDPSLALRQE